MILMDKENYFWIALLIVIAAAGIWYKYFYSPSISLSVLLVACLPLRP